MGHAALLMEKRITQEAEAGGRSARGPTRQSKAPSLATPGSMRVETVSRPGRRYSHLSVSCVSASHENTRKGLREKKKKVRFVRMPHPEQPGQDSLRLPLIPSLPELNHGEKTHGGWWVQEKRKKCTGKEARRSPPPSLPQACRPEAGQAGREAEPVSA